MEQGEAGDALNLEDDPGWPVNWWFLLALIPYAGPWLLRRRVRKQRTDALGALRLLFISLCTAVVGFGFVLLFIRDVPNGPVLPWLLILLGIAAVVIVVPAVIERPLDCSSDSQLASSYRVRFFLRTAFGQSVALFAFVFTFIGGPRWIYDIGLAITLIYFWSRVAPTRRALLRDQDALQEHGCGRSLVRALRSTEGDISPSRRRQAPWSRLRRRAQGS